jgi:hypothetical protein
MVRLIQHCNTQDCVFAFRDVEGLGCTSARSQAEPDTGADALQRPLRSRFQARLSRSVDMIDIASGCAKRTYTSDFWRNRCVNHRYLLICTQGKS